MAERNLYLREGTYWLCVTVRGHRRRESLRTGDIKLARKARDARLAELKAQSRFGERISWKQAVAAYIEHETGQIAPTTAKRYAVSLMRCEPFFSGQSIAEIDGASIWTFMQARRRWATPATIRRDLTAVSRVLEYAEARGWREGNPTLSKRRLLKERRDPIVLPEAGSMDMLLASASRRFGAVIRCALHTGCRQNELVFSTWKNFDAGARTLVVVGKGNKRRTISLSPEATSHILATPPTLGSPYIFCREDGTPFRQAASDFTHFRRAAETKAKKEGKPFRRFRFHDLRHLYAVNALKAGMSIYDLQKHLGHSTIGVTEMYLEFLTPDEERHAKRGSKTA